MNVVNKRAGEPQKLIVLLTIIIGEKHAKTKCTSLRNKCQWENKTAMKDLKAEFGKLGYENATVRLNVKKTARKSGSRIKTNLFLL